MKNDTKEVTVARMNPTGTRILVLKGTRVGSQGWGEDHLGCFVLAVVGEESHIAEELVRELSDYGYHLPWVYGDYYEQLIKLGALIGIDVDVAS